VRGNSIRHIANLAPSPVVGKQAKPSSKDLARTESLWARRTWEFVRGRTRHSARRPGVLTVHEPLYNAGVGGQLESCHTHHRVEPKLDLERWRQWWRWKCFIEFPCLNSVRQVCIVVIVITIAVASLAIKA